MKKRIYYIIYTIIQIVFGIYGFLAAKNIVTDQLKNVDLSKFPKEIADLYSVEMLTNSYRFIMIISTIIGIILLVMFLKNKKLEKKGLTIGLLIASIFTSLDIVVLLAIVTLIIVFTDKGNAVEKVKMVKKEKKELPSIPLVKETKKDYIAGIILILAYFGQLLFVPLIYKVTNNSAFSTVFYELVILFVAVWAFKDRYKRDFKYLKDNFGDYVKKSFKYWLIMLAFVFVAGFIQVMLGVDSESTNQATLKTLPFWYLIPSVIIYAPIVEETLFRGVFRRFIKNDIAFIIISGVAFGLLHTFLSEDGLYNIIVHSLNYVTMGAVLAYVYAKTNNIYTSMMVHVIQNTFAIIFIIIETFM